MNSQWNASQTGNLKWLNFSIAYQAAGGDFTNTKATAQHRMYQASAWETLARSTKFDAASPKSTIRTVRTFYPEFAAVPTNAAPDVNLPNANARGALNIQWMTDVIAYEIVLDCSGSMSSGAGSAMETAKSAAQYLVDAS